MKTFDPKGFASVKSMAAPDKRRGYTLIEIMIVIAIIGILFSVISYTYGKIKKNVYEKSCTQNMRTIYGAAQSYWVERGTLPNNSQQLTCRLLLEEGYIRKIPKCPWASSPYDASKAFYTITGEKKDLVLVECVNRENPKYSHGLYKYGDKK